jgi:selT/selW/selH-like putative selenoprotein
VEAEVKAKFPEARITLLEGGGGVFDVKCDGKLIFSKLGVKGQRFPHEGEITRLIDKEIG